jgi:hypothetical protein
MLIALSLVAQLRFSQIWRTKLECLCQSSSERCSNMQNLSVNEAASFALGYKNASPLRVIQAVRCGQSFVFGGHVYTQNFVSGCYNEYCNNLKL